MSITTAFKSDIEIALGGSLIDVELTQADYDYGFDKAIRTFAQHGNNNLDRKFVNFAVVPDTLSYVIPSNENIDTVVRIIRPQTVYNAADPFYSAFIQEFWGDFNALGDNMANYELGKQTLKTWEKYTLRDTQFIWKKRSSTVTLLNNPKLSENWALEVYADLTNEEYEEHLWVRNYTIAECKIILGSAYRKFSSLSTPTGEATLAGNEMISEGKEAQSILMEEIGNYTDGDPTGSIIIMG